VSLRLSLSWIAVIVTVTDTDIVIGMVLLMDLITGKKRRRSSKCRL
jgi:hypothetical protein